ncbi:MAG: hypothetical protein ABFE13_10145 [Phycisphaerales bacterium]
MKSRNTLCVFVACLASLWLVASCDTLTVHRHHHQNSGIGNGPPAHANAYGYRSKRVCGYDLVYDDACCVYLVVGVTDCYYHEGHFYRLHGGIWEISLRADVWEPAGYDRLPPGLRIKSKALVSTGNGNKVVKLNGNGNSLVKLNGNGNSVMKLNGNSNGRSAAKGRK